jgi:hypothetical protein
LVYSDQDGACCKLDRAVSQIIPATVGCRNNSRNRRGHFSTIAARRYNEGGTSRSLNGQCIGHCESRRADCASSRIIIVAFPGQSGQMNVMANTLRKAKRAPNAAFMKPVTPDDKLGKVVGEKPLPRTELTKKLWAYLSMQMRT